MFLTRSSWGKEFHYNYGIDGGINLSNISSSSSSSSTSTRLGAVGGLYWEFFPKEVISGVAGGYIVGKGYKEDSKRSVVLNYFQLRTLGRLSLARTRESKLYFDLGPTADFIFQKGTQNYSPAPQMTNFRNFDVSFMGGLGYELDIQKTTRLAFNLKYSYGLLNIVKDTTTSIHSNGILFTTAVQFSTEADVVEQTEERARRYLENKNSETP